MKEENDMKDLILICAVAAVFVFGYFIAKKVDVFLENNRTQISELSRSSSLRIAFETPLMVEPAFEFIEKFLKQNSNCKLELFSGSAQEIANKLEANEIDFGFITKKSTCTFNKEYVSIVFPLEPSTIALDSIGYSVIPLENSEIMTQIIWNEMDGSYYQKKFAEYINNNVFKVKLQIK